MQIYSQSLSNTNEFILNKLTSEWVQSFADKQPLPMFLSIFEVTSVGDAFFDKCLHSFAIGLFGRAFSLKLHFLITLSHQIHFESVFVLQEPLHKV